MSAPLSPERCACRATLATDPAAAEHEKWCAWVKPTPERIAEIKAGTGPVMLAGELKWLAGDASRAELHISGAAAGAFPLSDDLPGMVAELGRKLGAVVAELDRTRTALAESENDLTGARLDLWEEEQDTRRLRLALKSARRGRARARQRVAELLAERLPLAPRERLTLRFALQVLTDAVETDLAIITDDDRAAMTRLRALSTGPTVAYRNPWQPHVLLCLEHGEGWAGMKPLSVEDLPNGGTCTAGDPADPDDVCGRDVLDAAAEHEFAVEAGHAAPDRVLPWLADLDPGDVQDLASSLATATVGWQREPEIVLARVEWALEEIRARVAGGGETE